MPGRPYVFDRLVTLMTRSESVAATGSGSPKVISRYVSSRRRRAVPWRSTSPITASRVTRSSVVPVGLCGVVRLTSRVSGRRSVAIRSGSTAQPSSYARSRNDTSAPIARGVSTFVA